MSLQPTPTDPRFLKTPSLFENTLQAILLDPSDGHSWFVLGNAHLALFFLNMTLAENVDMVRRLSPLIFILLINSA